MDCCSCEVTCMNTTTDPQRTYALVVGIEEYNAGGAWNRRDGPAADARRFCNWLISRGVLPDNIALCLAPRPDHVSLLPSGVPAAQPATCAAISDTLMTKISALRGDLLYLFWGGHGMITADETRRLFCADATPQNLRNVDLNSLMTTLRS